VDEFASGTLVAAVLRSLAADGLPVTPVPAHGALVPLAVKRRLLADIERAHGLAPLLRVGFHLLGGPDDPVLAALRAAAGPADLFERWQRLERFTHSRHRVRVRRSERSRLSAEHVGPSGKPPSAAEDALVLGLLTALLSGIGARDLTVHLEAGRPVHTGGVFGDLGPGDTARWHFAWTSVVPPAPAGGDVRETGLAARTRSLLAGDPARRWTLAVIAAELAVPARTLQRHLPVGGLTGLLAAVRAEAAAHLLRAGRHPLGVIGFTSGYSDQPHFTREFRRRTAMTPGQFRAAFLQENPCSSKARPSSSPAPPAASAAP
jgi:AraC-like DNA-binding protein